MRTKFKARFGGVVAMMPARGHQRSIRTWRCGEVGLMGTRRVLEGGRIVIGGSRGSKLDRRVIESERLLPFVGEIVHFHDGDDMQGRIFVSSCVWHINGRVSADKLLCFVRPREEAKVARRGGAAVGSG